MNHWTTRAACLGASGNLFFPDPHNPAAGRAAQATCNRCDVAAECLAETLTHERGHGDHRLIAGIRGGLTATQRSKLLDLFGDPL